MDMIQHCTKCPLMKLVIFRGNGTTEVYLFNSKDNKMTKYNNNGNIKPLGDQHRNSQQYRYQDSIYSVGRLMAIFTCLVQRSANVIQSHMITAKG